MRSSTSSVALTHMTGIALIDGVARIWLQTSIAVLGPLEMSRITSWCSATFGSAFSASATTVTA